MEKDKKKKDKKKEEGTMEGGEEPIEAEGTEVLEAEPKNILLSLLSQLSLGMDLSRVTLPTFILEPKSFLEKLTDFMTHPDLVLNASALDTPYDRLKALTRWYMSGFYIRPKGVKKPYNPILGEIFRASWDHGDSKSFYVSEQVSHHPPVSAFYGSNRAAGFVLNGSIFFKSKFGGNTVAAILDGHATIYMLNYDETYVLTFPTAYARGILWGTLLMELGGTVSIKCEQSEMKSEIEFKTKPFFGGDYNQVAGKIIHKKKTLYNFNGKWDKQLTGKGHKDKKEEVFWDPYGGMSQSNLKMNVRPISEQEDFESRKLWQGVSKGLLANDQEAATDAKCAIESAQRQAVKDREEKGIVYEPRYFKVNEEGEWEYKWFDVTKWDAEDCASKEEYEEDGEIKIRAKSK